MTTNQSNFPTLQDAQSFGFSAAKQFKVTFDNAVMYDDHCLIEFTTSYNNHKTTISMWFYEKTIKILVIIQGIWYIKLCTIKNWYQNYMEVMMYGFKAINDGKPLDWLDEMFSDHRI